MVTNLQTTTIPVYLGLGVLAVLFNILLIIVVLRLPNRKRELNLTLGIACIDLFMASNAIGVTSMFLVTGHTLDDLRGACQVKGPLDFFGLYFSMLLVFIVAYLRSKRIMNISPPRAVWGMIGFYSTVYCFLVISVALHGEYHLLGNGVDCSPIASYSTLSAILIFFLGFSLFSLMTLTIGCYLKILFIVLPDNCFQNSIELQDRPAIELASNKSSKLPRLRRQVVAVRTSLICISYFVIITPACFLLLVEAIVPQEDSLVMGAIIDFCLASIAVINPCLVLFAHSLIYSQLLELFYAK